MMLLENLVITEADLKAKRPDIDRYMFGDDPDYSGVIAEADRDEFRRIKQKLSVQYPYYSQSELNTLTGSVKDIPDETPIHDRLVLFTLSKVFAMNDRYEEAEYYKREAREIPLKFYIDENQDGEPDLGEDSKHSRTAYRFGR